MYSVRKKTGKIVKAYRVSSDSEMIASLIAEGKMKYLGNAAYEVFSREAKGEKGQLCHEGDYIKLDSEGYPYPNTEAFFIKNHVHLTGDEYEQIPRVLSAWDCNEPECEEIRFLKEEKGLVIDEANEEAYYTAPLWGTILHAPKDAILVFYQIDRDEKGKLTDISFNFVVRPEFEKTYVYVSTEKNILVVTLSYINHPGKFEENEYENDEEPVVGWFTSEAPTKYLIRKLYRQTYSFFDTIVVLSTKDCHEKPVKTEHPRAKGLTSEQYFEKAVLEYMEEINPEGFQKIFPTKEDREKLFRYVYVDPEGETATKEIMKALMERVDNPWDANVYMDFTGGFRKESLAGMMVMRCLDASGYRSRCVVYSLLPGDTEEKRRIIDMTETYRMFDAIIARAMIEDRDYHGVREDTAQIIDRYDMAESMKEVLKEYGGTEDDLRDYATSYQGEAPYIFLSYSHKDMLFAQSFLKNMHRRGIDRIWYDKGIKPSVLWDVEITDRLEHSSLFLMLVSENYKNSEYCQKELDLAKEDPDKKILIIYLDRVKPFEEYKELNQFQAIMRQEYSREGFYDKIFETPGICHYHS